MVYLAGEEVIEELRGVWKAVEWYTFRLHREAPDWRGMGTKLGFGLVTFDANNLHLCDRLS